MFTYSFKSSENYPLRRIVISGHNITLFTQKNPIALSILIQQYTASHPSQTDTNNYPFHGFLHNDLILFDKLNHTEPHVQFSFDKEDRLENLKEICQFLLTNNYLRQEEIEPLIKKYMHFITNKNLDAFITKTTRYLEKIDLQISQCHTNRDLSHDDHALFDYYYLFFRLQEALLGIQHKNNLYWHWQAKSCIAAIRKSQYSKKFDSLATEADLFNTTISDLAQIVNNSREKILKLDLLLITVITSICYAYTELYLENSNSLSHIKDNLKTSAILALTAQLIYHAKKPLYHAYRFFTCKNQQNQKSENSSVQIRAVTQKKQ